jgi:hypothetical protein
MADNEYNKSSAPVKTKTNMKKLVLLLTLTLTALPAFADLGFTYDQVVKEMGGVKGTPTKLDGWKLPNWVWWPPKGHIALNSIFSSIIIGSYRFSKVALHPY